MAIIEWDKSLSVKISSIDVQHKKLIDLINSFYENINQGSTKEKILELIKALKDYTVVHFSTEEKYMKQFHFPGYESHKKEHDRFVETVLNFEEKYKNGKFVLTLEITNFIKEWVTKHIMGTDQKYADFFVQKGLK